MDDEEMTSRRVLDLIAMGLLTAFALYATAIVGIFVIAALRH